MVRHLLYPNNAAGWTIEARLPNSEYIGERDFTHIEGIVLSGPELARAILCAEL